MDELGIHSANIGLPGAAERFERDVYRLTKEIADRIYRISWIIVDRCQEENGQIQLTSPTK